MAAVSAQDRLVVDGKPPRYPPAMTTPAPFLPSRPPPSAAALRAELEWSLFGPELMPESGLKKVILGDECREALVSAPVDLDRPLPRQLGRRFERHWQWALAHAPGWSLHGHSIQVKQGKRTVGELDLLATGPDGRCWHVELAVKFYLCRRGLSGEDDAHWVGPAGRDRLDLKLDRMRNHQVLMGQTPDAHETLKARGLPVPDRAGAVLRGVLFADWRQPHLRASGLWCTAAELPLALDRACVLSRTAWLGHEGGALLHGSDLMQAVSAELERGAAQLVDPTGRRWLVLGEAR